MKPYNRLWLRAAFVVVLVACFVAPTVYAGEKEEVTIVGVVAKVKDDQGKTRIMIQTDEGAFEVAKKKGKGKELKKLVDQRVQATGIVKEKNGQRKIIVSEYKVIE